MNDKTNKKTHEHCNNTECTCGNDEVATLSISLDDGTEVECNVLGVFEVNGNDYIALMPFDDEDVLLYSYKEIGDEIELNEIEDDDLYYEVSDTFFSIINEDDDFDDDDDDDGYAYTEEDDDDL